PNQRPLPTMYDLPSEAVGEPGLPDEFHRMQAELLRETCRSPQYSGGPSSLEEGSDGVSRSLFIASDLNLYYDSRNPKLYKRPDWFLCLDVPKLEKQADLRWSYLIWQESVAPFLVIEFLSPGTEAEDLGETVRRIDQPPRKWDVYERFLRIPYYALYNRYDNNFRLFQLDGLKYREVDLPNARFWFDELGLGLAIWTGRYEDAEGLWLRWYTADNQWIPTELERAEQAEAQVDIERERAEQAEAKYQALLKKLQEQGMDLNDL
ncbi:MAG: Uma2 family endonuclease, partial [Okeania sp. SIO2H7]|nr:Uma2 family endonuclease [Okeania sp. SIO2H7]